MRKCKQFFSFYEEEHGLSSDDALYLFFGKAHGVLPLFFVVGCKERCPVNGRQNREGQACSLLRTSAEGGGIRIRGAAKRGIERLAATGGSAGKQDGAVVRIR